MVAKSHLHTAKRNLIRRPKNNASPSLQRTVGQGNKAQIVHLPEVTVIAAPAWRITNPNLNSLHQ
jgi:hypothetical protein